eukprot:GHUV01039373.1.p3 GENE.GHUV01039373.1~~GHUV01039373.1.p3  ORF type:complete len:124 (+),score=28.84 GHUV01039373.1:159-530(+)
MSLLVMQPVAAKKGASSVEVYGFAGWILSAVAFALYCLWAFVPEPVLHSIGITYYPTKEWALIIPTLIIFSVLFVYWVYESLNMMSVAEPTALTTIHGELQQTPTPQNASTTAVVRGATTLRG